MTVNVGLDYVAEVVLVRFLSCKVILPLTFNTVYWKDVTMSDPHLKSRKLCYASSLFV